MGGYVFAGISMLLFKSDCHHRLSVIPLATGDEVIKC